MLAQFGNSLKKSLLDSFPEFANQGMIKTKKNQLKYKTQISKNNSNKPNSSIFSCLFSTTTIELAEEWVTKGFWKNEKNQRKFFEDIAHQLAFDPLDMAKWDSLRISSLVTNKKVTYSTYKQKRKRKLKAKKSKQKIQN